MLGKPLVCLRSCERYQVVLMVLFRLSKDMYNGYSWQMRILEVRADRIPPDMDLSNPMNTLAFPKSHSSNMHPVPFIPPINGAFVQYQDPALSMLQAKMTESQSNLGLSAPPMGSRSTPTSPPLPGVSAGSQGRNLFVGNVRQAFVLDSRFGFNQYICSFLSTVSGRI